MAAYEKIVEDITKFKGNIMPGLTGFMRCAKFGDFEIQNQINNKTPYLDLKDPNQLKIYQGLRRCYELFIAYSSQYKEDIKVIISPQN
jgi:hypothetical protein